MTAPNKIDLHILHHAVTFGLGVWLPDPLTAGGTVLRCGTVSEARQYEAAERLADAGYMARVTPPPPARTRRRAHLMRYDITPEGRAAVRAHLGLGPLASDAARAAHTSDLARLWGGDPVADRHLALRAQGGALVRGVLAALGHRYHGTGGWHITAYATPDLMIGLVNIADGVAVATTAAIDAETVEALTLPGQDDGPIASGAAAWTSPDAGEGRQAQAPVGWRQLLVDVRCSGRDDPAIPVSATVVAWGLMTCYRHRGAPGITTIAPAPDAARLRPDDWPVPPEARARMQAIAVRWLDGLARELAGVAGCGDAVAAALDAPGSDAARLGRAVSATGIYAMRSSVYDHVDALRSAMRADRDRDRIPVAACRDARVTRIADLAGDYCTDRASGARYHDLVAGLVEIILAQRLTPIAESVGAMLAPMCPPGIAPTHRDGGVAWWTCHHATPMLGEVARLLAPIALAGVAARAQACEAEAIAALYADGPISLALPVEVAA